MEQTSSIILELLLNKIFSVEFNLFHRYAYVNVRNWLTKNVNVQDPLKPPPISQNVSLYVLDLVTRQLTPFPPLEGHKAFTPAVECLFLFLDVSANFVAR